MKTVKLLQPLLICIIISMFGCSGQSTTGDMMEMAPASTVDEMAMDDGAALYILNLSGWTLIPQDQVVLDNGQELVSLPRNTFARIIITTGSHEISFPYRQEPTLNLDAVKGETYYLKVVHETRTSWAYSIEGDPIELEQLTEGEAKILLEKLKPLSKTDRKTVPAPTDDKQVSVEENKSRLQTDESPSMAAKIEMDAMASSPAVEPESPVVTKPVAKMIEPPETSSENKLASVPPVEKMITGDNATLFIFNLSGWTLLSGNQIVLDNGSELVSLPRNTYSKEAISPGRHALGFKNREEPKLILDVTKGQTYYVSFAYQQKSSWVSTTKTDPIEIKQLSEENARQLMKRITYYH